MKSIATRRTVLAAGLVAAVAGPRMATRQTAAQEDACAVATASAEGITIEPIGFGAPASTPGHGLTLYRFSIPPGGVVEPHRHPGATILAVERGELAYTLLRGSASVQRKETGGEDLIPGGESILRPGDSLFYDADADHTARNPGTIPVLVLAVTLLATDQPATIPTDEHGMEMG